MKTKAEMTHPEDDLDALFALARATPLEPDAAFLARILTDAEALQPKPSPLRPSALPAQNRGFWSRLAAALGGAVVVAGIGSAAMAGLVVGYVQPEPMLNFAEELGLAEDLGLGEAESLDLMPSYALLLNVDTNE